MTHQARYNAMQVDKYGCYCELYKCRPFCSIPKGKPKIWKTERTCYFIILGVVIAVIIALAMIIALCVTQIEPCQDEFDCGNGKCINTNKHCDGVKDCAQWRDETGCSAKLKFVPSYAVGLVGRNGRILSRAVLGDHELQWLITNPSGEVTTLSVKTDSGALTNEYGVRRRSQSNRVDLNIWYVQPHHLDYTFSAHLPSGDRTEQIRFIPVESMSCTPSETGIRLAEGETATFVATVTYYGNTEPALYWYKDNQIIDSSTSSIVGDQYTTMTVTAIVTAERDLNGVVFQAYLFEAFPLDTINSPPSNSADMCETRLNVLFSARNTRTNYKKKNKNGKKKIYKPGKKRIRCKADGNPEPEVKWYCSDGQYFKYGSVLTIPLGAPTTMTCMCFSHNTINNVTYNDQETITFLTSGASILINTLNSIVGTVFIACYFL